MKKSFGIVVCGLAACTLMAAEQRWRDDLWLGRGGYWRARVGVTVENTSDEAWEGRSVSVPLAKLPLAGARVEEVRLVDARGVQLEFGVWSGHSEFVTEGPVPADGMFVIPVVCDAHASADFCIYYDNPAAWGLADFWKERPAKLLNGSFEAIGKDCPEGWRLCIPDAQHRLSVDTAAYAGARCIKAEADAGAAPSWFSFSQDSIPVRAGERITLRVMVRAQDVKGQAGWYVHAGHEKRSDVLNRVFSAGNGTFDWKKLEMKVTIPTNCTKMTVGSVLRGTGTAWYDAFEIERETPLPEPKVTVGAAERLNVREIGADAPWLAAKPGEGAWQYRVPVRAANFTGEALPQTLSACALSEALRATRSAEFALTFNGRELRTCQLGNQLLFSCELPARSISTFYLYVRSGRGGAPATQPEELKSALGSAIPSDQILVKRPRLGDAKVFEALLNGPANLVRNPSWEADRAGWTTGPGKPDGISYEVVTTGGRFGSAFAKVEIPRTVRPNWNGWRQQVKVKPGHMYLYGAFISGDDLQTYATVHMHQRTARGALAQGGMMSSGRGVNGTAPWTPVFGTARASTDAATFDLQLTMNGTGTVAYDGVLVAEYAAARTGDPEFPAPEAGAPALRVVQVDPVVKVFRETPVSPVRGDNIAAFGISLARNETEPLQLAVRTSRNAADLTAQVELPAPLKVEVGRVRHVPVDHPTSYYSCTTPAWELRYPRNGGSSDGWGGWWPDPIDPVVGGPAPANETQVFWINVTAGADVPPGMYTGKITWKADGATVRTDTFSVKVWNFTLDAPPYFPAIYDLRVGWQWKGLGATSDERREKLWAFLAKKKCCPDRLGAEVRFKKGADGTVTADFTEYLPRLLHVRLLLLLRLGDAAEGVPRREPLRGRVALRGRGLDEAASRLQEPLPAGAASLLEPREGEGVGGQARALHLRRAALLAHERGAADEGVLRDDPRSRPEDPDLLEHVAALPRVERLSQRVGHRPLRLLPRGRDEGAREGGEPLLVDDGRADVHGHAVLRGGASAAALRARVRCGRLRVLGMHVAHLRSVEVRLACLHPPVGHARPDVLGALPGGRRLPHLPAARRRHGARVDHPSRGGARRRGGLQLPCAAGAPCGGEGSARGGGGSARGRVPRACIDPERRRTLLHADPAGTGEVGVPASARG